MFKVNNKDTGTTPIFIVNFEHISLLVLVFLWLTFNFKLAQILLKIFPSKLLQLGYN